MGAGGHEYEIFIVIVEAVPIQMMNVLVATQRPFQFLLDDRAVFQLPAALPFDFDHPVRRALRSFRDSSCSGWFHVCKPRFDQSSTLGFRLWATMSLCIERVATKFSRTVVHLHDRFTAAAAAQAHLSVAALWMVCSVCRSPILTKAN